ncbi:hypothetical protein PMAYCL1PPCAC_21484, partial [Pristionchus mayeri]
YVVAAVGMTAASALQTLAVALLTCPELLIAGRGLMSFFSSLSDAALVMYLQEASPTHLRGTLSSLFCTMTVVMGLVGMLLGCVLDQSLPLLVSIPIPVGILSIAFLVFVPETPKYLLTKSDKEGALRSLVFFQGNQHDHEEILHGWKAMEED